MKVRLTKKCDANELHGVVDESGTIMDCSALCEEVEYNCDECPLQKAFNKLGELEDKIEKGVLIEIPCPIGTTIYILCKNQRYINVGEFRISDLSEWGKRIFATPKEALKVAPNAELCEAAKLIVNEGTRVEKS